MSNKQVKSIVTPEVLLMDKRSCDSLLKGILREKIMDDEKKNLIQKERQILRNKLALKHNQRIIQANQLGVKMRASSINMNDKEKLKLNLNKIQADTTSLEVNPGANSSIENTSAGLNETFLNSKRMNNTTYGDASLL